tara:strand:- start:285 stop:905 length:621 start_codon:yes stop_codon:yes gene_type:complete
MGFIGVQPASVPLTADDVPDLPATKITSGTFPALNGSNLTSLTAGNLSGTLPAISGANLTGISAGKTIQVKEEKSGGSAVTLGTSYSDILSLNFTPLESNSSLVIVGTVQMFMSGDGSYNSLVRARYYNSTDSSTLSASTIDVYQGYGGGTADRGNVFPSMLWYGSHWGTSQKTIKIQCARPEAGGNGIIDNYNGRTRIIIMEIST